VGYVSILMDLTGGIKMVFSEFYTLLLSFLRENSLILTINYGYTHIILYLLN